MSVIKENILRAAETGSMNEHHIKAKDEKRAEVAADVEAFFQAGGHTQHIKRGVGAFEFMNGRKYLATMQACTTESNRISRAKKMPFNR